MGIAFRSATSVSNFEFWMKAPPDIHQRNATATPGPSKLSDLIDLPDSMS